MNDLENWVGILDYAKLRGLSISTIRRKIKQKKLKYELINGKYFIFADNFNSNEESTKHEFYLALENRQLKKEIIKMKEEMLELKMLINLYENKK